MKPTRGAHESLMDFRSGSKIQQRSRRWPRSCAGHRAKAPAMKGIRRHKPRKREGGGGTFLRRSCVFGAVSEPPVEFCPVSHELQLEFGCQVRPAFAAGMRANTRDFRCLRACRGVAALRVLCLSLSLFSWWRWRCAGMAGARVSRRAWRAVPRSAVPGGRGGSSFLTGCVLGGAASRSRARTR